MRRRQTDDGRLTYLHVTTQEGPFTSQYPLAAYEQGVTAEELQHFLDHIHRAYRETDPGVRSQIVCGGATLDPQFVQQASAAGVWVRSFVEYQGLIDFGGYVRRQTERLEADLIYPPALYFPSVSSSSSAPKRVPARMSWTRSSGGSANRTGDLSWC